MWLIIFLILMVALSFWAGFISKPHAGQYKSKAGFVIFIALMIFTSFYTYKENKTIDELYTLIEPLPETTEVNFIPTVPNKDNKNVRYWSVITNLKVNEVVDFYTKNHSSWSLKKKDFPWMIYTSGTKELSLFISSNKKGSKVLYSLSNDTK